jgi:glycolate oxidase FAD binding subunit
VSIPSDVRAHLESVGVVDADVVDGAEVVVAPPTADAAASVLGIAGPAGTPVGFVGSGSRPELGGVIDHPIAMSTHAMADVIDWQVDDLTVTVGAGMHVGDLESMLEARNQTSLLPMIDPSRTVGGVVAEGSSGFARLKYGPTRDRVLEATVATGYGKVVRGGGRLVKNVTGYDLPRLFTGSLGSLGLITSVCLKLWPLPAVREMVAVEEAAAAYEFLYRPVSVLETEAGSFVMLEGSASDVSHQRDSIGGHPVASDGGPRLIDLPVTLSARIAPRNLAKAVELVVALDPSRWTAAHGVGTIDAGWGNLARDAFLTLRREIQQMGGTVVVIRGASVIGDVDPWGVTPSGIDVQRRMKAQFDPFNICNPGKLPGGL